MTCLGLLLVAAGCTRSRYRLQADRDVYGLIEQRTQSAPWQPPPGFTVDPHPLSRFYDPTPPTDPLLPIPAPELYAYQIPDALIGGPDEEPEEVPRGRADQEPPVPSADQSSAAAPWPHVQPVSWQEEVEQLPSPPGMGLETPGEGPRAGDLDDDLGVLNGQRQYNVLPLPPDAWDEIPGQCLDRMLEFDSVRSEYQRTFEQTDEAAEEEQQQVDLRDIVQLAQINNRAFQAEKESLYLTALRLTLACYEYQLRFTPSGNGTDVFFTHDRSRGETINTLSLPTNLAVEKMLFTGGDLLARFANSVVLTFNGPQGFAADVGSQLTLDLFQPLLQRDIRFESLTQAERDVIYTARDYARFRKILFRDLAAAYYDLLLSYRNIEIGAQDYFSNYRAFQQGQAEYRAGELPRFQVDQFEQNVLSSRSNLIRSCNNLESSLDRMKLLIGLPPEIELDLDLAELSELALRDEATVSRELVRRTRRDLVTELSKSTPDPSVVLNAAAELARRLLVLSDLGEELEQVAIDADQVRLLLAQFQVDEAATILQITREQLAEEEQKVSREPQRIFYRRMDVINALLVLIDRQLTLAQLQQLPAGEIELLNEQLQALEQRQDTIRDRVSELIQSLSLNLLQEPFADAAQLMADAEQTARQAARITQEGQPERSFEATLTRVTTILEIAVGVLEAEAAGLVPIELDTDAAMLTALTQRLDLMNERGGLADVWRQIKLAGDDLRSILNLRATQEIRTPADVNRAFDFTWDESTTRLELQFDAPLNRRAQRNSFRAALINYQAALRNLMEAEDSIKLAVRDDLRELQLDRQQYDIAVASAALAYERVISTRLQLQLGGNVAARDFLEAQQAYTESLSAVAQQHIGYVVDRIDLFLDLEGLQVNAAGFWPQLYEEEQQPEAIFRFPADGFPPYGSLPHVWYSRDIRRMLCVPDGVPAVYEPGYISEPGQPSDTADEASPLESGDEMPVPPEL